MAGWRARRLPDEKARSASSYDGCDDWCVLLEHASVPATHGASPHAPPRIETMGGYRKNSHRSSFGPRLALCPGQRSEIMCDDVQEVERMAAIGRLSIGIAHDFNNQ